MAVTATVPSLSGLLRQLVRRPVVVPAPKVRKPKRDLSQDDWLPIEEARALLAAAQGDPRAYAMLSVFLYTGTRCNELRMLDLEDYIPATLDRQAVIEIRHAKGSKSRTVPLPEQGVAALEYWLDHRQLAVGVEADCSALFRGRQGRLSNRYIRELVKVHSRAAGLGEKTHPHMLRHSFCTHLTLNEVPIEVVRVLAGHVSIATTQLYLSVPDKRRFEASARLDFS